MKQIFGDGFWLPSRRNWCHYKVGADASSFDPGMFAGRQNYNFPQKLCETFDTKHGIKVGCVGMKRDDYNYNLCHRGSTLTSYESIVSFVEGKEDDFAHFTLVFINNRWCGISSFNRSMPFSSFHPPQKASEGLDSSDTVTTFFEVKFTLLLCAWLCCSHNSEKVLVKCFLSIPLPETNSSHLKMDGWKLEDNRFLLGFNPFSGANMLVLGMR